MEPAAPGGSRGAGSPAPSPTSARAPLYHARSPEPGARGALSFDTLSFGGASHLAPSPARAHAPRQQALAFSALRTARCTGTMVSTVTSQEGALGEHGRVGRWGWGSRLCPSSLELGLGLPFVLSSCASSSLRRHLGIHGFFSFSLIRAEKTEGELAGTAGEGKMLLKEHFPDGD